MPEKPLFILGIGAEKAGTSWLHHYFAKRPDAAMSAPKELHVFDYHYAENGNSLKQRRLKKLVRKQTRRTRNRTAKSYDRLARRLVGSNLFWLGPDAYIPYFLKLASRPHAKMVGEFTPTYMALPADAWTEIRELLEPEFNVKIIFLMRDPISRLHSRTQRYRDRRIANGLLKKLGSSVEFYLSHRTGRLKKLTEYHVTMERLESAFDRDQIYYGFYETLMQPESIEDLCEFLGIDYFEPAFDRRKNKTESKARLQPFAVNAARRYYDPVYQACMKKFGEETIRKIWPSA